MPGVKVRYTGSAGVVAVGEGERDGGIVPEAGACARPTVGASARSRVIRTNCMTQYIDRKRRRARRVSEPACIAMREAQTLRTFCACKPFGPWATSNSTVSPSARLRKPSAWIPVKWTNTSGPDSCAIKPKPFASLNHFTLPFAITFLPSVTGASAPDWFDPDHRDLGRAQTKTARRCGPRGAQTAGDGATYCLNRAQRYERLTTLSIDTVS